MQICVYGASSNTIEESYLQAGEALGLAMAARGHGLVFGGGQKGMMGAVARGMTRGGGQIVGVAPRFFDVAGVLYEDCADANWTAIKAEKGEIGVLKDICQLNEDEAIFKNIMACIEKIKADRNAVITETANN